MKYGHTYLFPLIMFVGFITSCTHACPTCVGSLTPQSAPFWSNNLYQSTQHTQHTEDEIASAHASESSADPKTVVKKMENTHDTQ